MDTKHKYCYSIFSGSKHYGSKPSFIYSNRLPSQGFSSLYQVTAETACAIEQAGTAAAYKGCVWGERLWIDVDSYEEAEKVDSRLRKEGYDYVSYDSGGRGAHFGVLRDHEPSHLLPVKDKAWVKANFQEADTSIYTHLHLFRLPGSIHEKTGRAKQLVESIRGRALKLPPLEMREVKLSGNVNSGGDISVFDCFSVMANTIPVKNGNRHPTLVKLAYALKDQAGANADFAYQWLIETNKMFEDPRSEEHIEQIIRSVYGSF